MDAQAVPGELAVAAGGEGDPVDGPPAIEVRSLARRAEAGREWRGANRQRRLRRLPVILALGVSVGIVLIAFTGPRLTARPALDLSFLVTPSPSPTPTPTPSYGISLPTPLPRLTYGLGPRPTEPVLLDIGQGIQRFDPQSGELSMPLQMNVWENTYIPAAGGGYICVCFSRTNDGVETLEASIGRLGADGGFVKGLPVSTYRSSGFLNDEPARASYDVDALPDVSAIYVATGTIAPGSFTIHLDAIDSQSRKVIDRLDVARLALPESDPKFVRPTPSPGMDPAQAYPNGPGVRVAPDGRHLVVWGWIDRWDPSVESPPSPAQAWLVDLDPAAGKERFGAVHEIRAAQILPTLRNCGLADWLDAERLVMNCQLDYAVNQQFLIYGLDGRLQQAAEIPTNGAEQWGGELLMDRAVDRLWMWNQMEHRLSWLDVPNGNVNTVEVDPKTPPGRIIGSPTAAPRDALWNDLGSTLWRASGSLVGSPDGSRLFALGRRNDSGGGGRRGDGSTGIWVFDARSGALIDHWAPATAYGYVAISHDGQWVMAVGQPEVDAEGNQTSWSASLTFHHIETGEIGLRLSGFDDSQAWVSLLP